MSIDPETLRQRLQQLRLAGVRLAELLQGHADRLETGESPPSTDLVIELRKYREQHANLSAQLDPEANAASPQRPRSLNEIEQDLQLRESAQCALSVARSILQLKTRDGQSLASLDLMQSEARELIASHGDNLPSDQLQLFVDGQHPWHDLLRMIHQGDSLPDAEWTTLNASIESSLGRSVAIAVARGRLEINSSAQDDDELMASKVPPHPADQAPARPVIEPGNSASPASRPTISSTKQSGRVVVPEEASSQPPPPSPLLSSRLGGSTDSVFDDIEPVRLNRKFASKTSGGQTSGGPSLIPASNGANSIFDEPIDEPRRGQRGADVTVESPQPTRPTFKSHSPLAERLLSLARFSDATGAAANLATMILNGPEADRADLLPDLILHLIHENRSGLAFHLSRCLEARANRRRPFVPAWLIRTWAFGHALNFPKGQLAGQLQDELQSQPMNDLREGTPEWRLALSLLVRASTLRPAIIAPGTRAASLLRDFELQEGCVHLYNYCSRIGAYGERIQGVLPGTFKQSSSSLSQTEQLAKLRSDLTSWKESANTIPLKLQITSQLFQKAGWSLRAGTSQRHPQAALDWASWLIAARIGESLTSPILEDQRRELVRVKADLDEVTAQLSASESSEGHRQFSQPDVRAYLRQAVTFAQRWISLHHSPAQGDSQNYLPQAATELRAEIQSRHEPVLEELRALATEHSSFEVRMAVSYLMQSVQEVHRLVDPNIPAELHEPDPRHLLHAELLKIADLRVGANWEPEVDLPSLEEEILQFLCQPQPDWLMAFKMQSARGHHHLAERILSLSHWSNAERVALQGVLESDRQRQRTDFVRELNEVKTLLAESVQLDILKDIERTGFETRIERLGRIVESDKDVATRASELGRVRELLIKRREREADRIRSRLRQLNAPSPQESDGNKSSESPSGTTRPRGWVMDFDP